MITMQPLLNCHMLTSPSVTCLRPQSIEDCSNRRFRMALKWNTAQRVHLFPSPLTEVPRPQPSMSMRHSCHFVRHLPLWHNKTGMKFWHLILLCFISPKGCISKVPHMLCLSLPSFFSLSTWFILKNSPNNLFHNLNISSVRKSTLKEIWKF